MPHVFVETNWLFAYAAPAHHQVPAAAELLDRARLGEFTMHMPNVCFVEARQPILTKCQPQREADAIRNFLTWAQPSGHVKRAQNPAPYAWVIDSATAPRTFEHYRYQYDQMFAEASRVYP